MDLGTSPFRPVGTAWTENEFQVCRALLVRNHPSALPLIRKLFGLFDDEEVNWDAAKAMGTSGAGGGQLLTKRFHAAVRVRPRHNVLFATRVPDDPMTQLLSSQKFFDGIVHDIVGGHKGTASEWVHDLSEELQVRISV
jgi:hypothetical protein